MPNSKPVKKVRQGVIPYEADQFEIGFENNSAAEYAHVVSEDTKPEDISLKSFQVKEKLNPKFWKDEKLDSRIRLKLLDIADDFTDFLNVDWVEPEDITMTGSLANYNWSDYSDVDLHIIIDYKKVDKRKEFVENYFRAKKDLWNNEHKDLTIYGFPVELYVQDKNEPHASSGVYSLEKNAWVVKPDKSKMDDNAINKEKVRSDAAKWMNKIDNIIARYSDNDTESEQEEIYDELDDVFDGIKKQRKQSFRQNKSEMSDGNITFKVLRRNGYLDKLYDKKTEIYDTLNSIDDGD